MSDDKPNVLDYSKPPPRRPNRLLRLFGLAVLLLVVVWFVVRALGL